MEREMAFAIEWLDEEQRKKEGANVTNWVADREKEIFLWSVGKHWQIRADGDYSETIMLRIQGKQFRFELMPSADFRNYVSGQKHKYIWERVIEYWPQDLNGYSYDEVINVLKEALIIKGGGALDNKENPDFTVIFNF